MTSSRPITFDADGEAEGQQQIDIQEAEGEQEVCEAMLQGATAHHPTTPGVWVRASGHAANNNLSRLAPRPPLIQGAQQNPEQLPSQSGLLSRLIQPSEGGDSSTPSAGRGVERSRGRNSIDFRMASAALSPSASSFGVSWRSLNHAGTRQTPWPASWDPSADWQSRVALRNVTMLGERKTTEEPHRRTRRERPVSSAVAAMQMAAHDTEMPHESMPLNFGRPESAQSLQPSLPQSYNTLPPGSLNGQSMCVNGSEASRSRFSSMLSMFFGQQNEDDSDLAAPLLNEAGCQVAAEDINDQDLLLHHQRDSLDGPSQEELEELENKPKMGSSFAQTTFNALNIVVGIALLSLPYIIGQVGLLGIPILVLYAGICLYTGVLLRRCMDAYSGMQGYPDIGWVAFGPTGRIVVSIVLYVELFMIGCELLILGGDSLSAIVPHPEHIPFLAWASFVPAQTFWCLVCCVGVMPTMFVRDLTFLSYVSAAGILVTSAIVLLVGGEAATTIGAGTSEWQPFEVVNWSGVMLALSMYAFCYSGHAVFPNLYNGMSTPEQYPGMMWVSLGMATVMYIVMGLIGFGMYGKDVGDNIVVQMRVDNPGSVWGTISTVLTASLPFTKFALTLSPVAEAVEELLPMSLKESKFQAFSMALRVALVGLAASVALSLPFFGYVAAVIGSICSITISVILPSICYISIYRDRRPLALAIPAIVAAFGVFCAVYGTYVSGSRLVQAIIQGAD